MDAKIAAAGTDELRWNLILRKARLFADRGTNEHLIYEHAMTLAYPVDHFGGAAINVLEIQVNAGLYGKSGDWFHEVQHKVSTYLITH